MSHTESRDSRDERITEPDNEPELNLDDEQKQKLQRIVRSETESSEIAEAILRRDGFS